MKKLVGFIVLEAVLAPICDPQEPLFSLLSNVNGKDENQIKEVMREYVKPYYDSFDERSKQIINDSILYFSFSEILQENVELDALPTPFELPNDVKKFCRLLQMELGIQPTSLDIKDCEYSDDLSLVHRLRRNRNSIK